MKCPTTPGEWREVARDYQEIWDFPHCIGALDGKHVVMQKPIRSGSTYHNYKGSESLVLMALVDANLR